MDAISLAILTAGFYGAYNFFIKLASGNVHQIVGAVILQIVAALLGGALLLYLVMTKETFLITSKGVQQAIWAGVFVGLAEIASFYVFSKGFSASVGIPVIVGGTVFFGAVLGILFLKETLTLSQIAGLGLMVAAIVLIAR